MKSSNKGNQSTNIFRKTVESIPDISAGYRDGLKALKGKHSSFVITDKEFLLGSVDIDACTSVMYPEEARWDYAIGYKGKAYFVEVHPACTSNVKEMIKKVIWMTKWLKEKGETLNAIKDSELWYWIPSGKFAMLKTSPQYRSLSHHHLQITSNPFCLK